MSDPSATAHLVATFPRLFGGEGPETGMAGDVTAALRYYFSASLERLEAELGDEFYTPAGEAAMGLTAQIVEGMLAWVAEQDGMPSVPARGADLPSRPAAHRRPSGGLRGRR